MDIVKNITEFFGKPKKETEGKVPEGLCPVCWGYEEYDHKIRKVFEDKQIDVNNHAASYMLMQKFVKENIDGIKLKEGEIHDCPTCGTASKK